MYLRHNANYVDLAQIHGYISRPSTVIYLHYHSYRAEPLRSGPSPPPLGGPGPHEILVGRARSDAFTLHQTGLGTVPSPVKLYSVNGALDTLSTQRYFQGKDFQESPPSFWIMRSQRSRRRDKGLFALFTNPPLAGAASLSVQYWARECNCCFFFISTKFNVLIFNTEYAT